MNKILFVSLILSFFTFANNINISKEYHKLKYNAQHGNIKAQISLAGLYSSGNLGKKDYNKSIYWLKKASKRSSLAQYKLASYYENGYGVNRDIKKAITLYKKAANNGSKTASVYLSELFYKGEIVPKDYNKSIYWIKKVSNEKEAQYRLAVMYEKGLGVEKDNKKAIYWYAKAANNGHTDAQYNLASIYYKEKKYKDAIFWFDKASNNGDDEAQYNLGLMYLKGLGTKRNKIIAFNYLITAAKMSNEKAQDALDLLCKESPWACR